MKRYLEEWLPWIISLATAILSFYFYPEWIKMDTLIEKFPDIGSLSDSSLRFSDLYIKEAARLLTILNVSILSIKGLYT